MLILDTVLYRPRGCPGYTSIHTSREPAFWLGVNDLFCVVIFKYVFGYYVKPGVGWWAPRAGLHSTD